MENSPGFLVVHMHCSVSGWSLVSQSPRQLERAATVLYLWLSRQSAHKKQQLNGVRLQGQADPLQVMLPCFPANRPEWPLGHSRGHSAGSSHLLSQFLNLEHEHLTVKWPPVTIEKELQVEALCGSTLTWLMEILTRPTTAPTRPTTALSAIIFVIYDVEIQDYQETNFLREKSYRKLLQLWTEHYWRLNKRCVYGPGNWDWSCGDLLPAANFPLQYHEKAELSHDAYGCCENIRESLSTPTATFPEICNGLLFRPILWMCVHNLEVCSFTWDNRGYSKNLGTPWICPRSLLSKIGGSGPHRLEILFGWTLWMYRPNLKSVALPVHEIIVTEVLGGGCEPPILQHRRP